MPQKLETVLKHVEEITQNFDGLPKFKAVFFNDIFYPCFAKKTEPASNNKEGKDRKEEEIKAVTTRELCDYFKVKRGKPISTDNLKHTYLNQLINEGIIDYTESKINSKQNIYYSLVTDSLSIESIMSPIDKDPLYSSTIYEKITKNITEGWIFHEIVGLVSYRLEQATIEVPDYIKDPEIFQIFDNNKYILEEQEGSRITLSISDFIEKYSHIVNIPIDNKRSNILTDFAKRSSFLLILAKIDAIDKKVNEESHEEKYHKEQ